MDSVSVVVPVFGRLDLTQQCLRTLADARPDVDLEVVVVDNGSPDGTRAWLHQQDVLEVTVVESDENLGFAGGCNLGVRAARGDYVCLLNNDVEVRPGFLDPHLEVLAADPRVGIVGSRLLFPDGTIQHAGVVLCDDRQNHDPFMAVHRHLGRPDDFPPAQEPMHYRAVTAALWTMRRDDWTELGGLDEGFWNGYEDVDLCLKVGADGGLVVYEPRSVAVHHESASGDERWRKVTDNTLRLHSRWAWRVPVDVVILPDGRPVLAPEPGFGPYTLPGGSVGA